MQEPTNKDKLSYELGHI